MYEFLRNNQLSIMLGLSCICGFAAFCVCVITTLSRRRKISLVLFEISAMLLLVFERFAYIYRGDESSIGYYMVRISNFVVFFMTLFVLFAFNLYLRDIFANKDNMKKTGLLLLITDTLVGVGILLLVISQFNGMYYTFDETNHYQRASLFWLSYVIPLLVLIIDMVFIYKCCRAVTKGVRFSLFLFSIGPLVASIFQLFAYGLSLISISIVALAIVLFVFAIMDTNETAESVSRMEIELLKNEQKSMQRLFEQTAMALVNSIDAKDKYTHGHSSRVADYSRKIAEMSGKSEKECDEVYYAALLHDVGKIGIKDAIINKEGRLTDDEYEQIKRHPQIGQAILSGISEFQYLSIGANYHHERYDGKGYPEKLKGEDIPELARIVAVADAYDAMSSKRSYRDPIPQQKIREEFVKGSGTQFDPKFAKLMIHLIDLDSEYEMKEKGEIRELSGKNELNCNEYRSEISEGIILQQNPTKIQLISSSTLSADLEKNIPTIVLFDSLDGRVYTDEKTMKEMVYCEYGEIRFDGETRLNAARNVKVEKKEGSFREKMSSDAVNEGKDKKYIVEAVRVSDHVLIKIISKNQIITVTVALPDSTRYCYIGLTGEHCTIRDVVISKDDKPVDDDYIPRIAEKISYIDGPEGDLPNVQVDAYRSDSTSGVLINDGLSVSFHGKSLPTARLVWHTPFIVLFHSDDGKVNGINYKEFALIRLDGESWETGGFAENKIIVNKKDSFNGWDEWKEFNRNGFDSVVRFEKSNDTITTYTENDGIQIKNLTKISGNADIIYMALTGDQVAITNIRLKDAHLHERLLKGEALSEFSDDTQGKVRSSIVKVSSNGKGEEEALAMTERLSANNGLDKKEKLHLRLLAEELIGLVKSVGEDITAEYYLEVSGKDYELHLNSEVEVTPEIKNKFTLAYGKGGTGSKGFMSRIRKIIGSALISRKESEFSWTLSSYIEEVKHKFDIKGDDLPYELDELEKSILANLADDINVRIEGYKVEIIVYVNKVTFSS